MKVPMRHGFARFRHSRKELFAKNEVRPEDKSIDKRRLSIPYLWTVSALGMMYSPTPSNGSRDRFTRTMESEVPIEYGGGDGNTIICNLGRMKGILLPAHIL